MRNIKIFAQQFSGKIRIGMTGVEQVDAIAQFVPFDRQFADFLLTLLEQMPVFTPGQQSAWPGNRHGKHDQKQAKGKALCQCFTR